MVYAVMRSQYPKEFHEGSLELNVFIGTLNSVILLISSATMAASLTAIQKNDKKMALRLVLTTLILAITFMVFKGYEWNHKLELHLYPGSEVMRNLAKGEIMFFGLYFMMTGLHALHIIIGCTLLTIVATKIKKESINSQNFLLLENSSLYWHLVDLVWIFLFPLLYLIS